MPVLRQELWARRATALEEGKPSRRGSLEPAAMDAVLEPFPADRLFPGSSFLDLGDLNESDFLNNAVR